MKSPFKFLDPFTLADRDVFFGRDKEIKELYQLVFKTPLLLVYGLSGTGKTSLIQCGLASQFDGPDWLPLWVRRQTNLNDSLDAALNRSLPEAHGPVSVRIQQLYRHYLRPVFLIFDQFEELFILGSTKEREQFQETLTTLLTQELPCTILLVMREEYLGRLYPIEKAIPNLFDFRMRVEPMDTANVKTVLRDSFQKFNISIGEPPEEKRLDFIIKNVSLERSGIELPYLQVYLDLLYREDLFIKVKEIEGDKWPKLELTQKEIDDFGTIENVLEKFLKEQEQRIQALLTKQYPILSDNIVRQVIDGFVTYEGTKRPILYKYEDGLLFPSHSHEKFFPVISRKAMNTCMRELEVAKILRSDLDFIELAHDSLAQIINKYRTDEQKHYNDIRRQIQSSNDTFSKTQEYLTRKQVALFEDVLLKLRLEQNEIDYFYESKKYREDEERKELNKERRLNKKLKKALHEAKISKLKVERALVQVRMEQAKNKQIIDAFYFYNDNLALAVKYKQGENKYGFINKDGKVLIDYKYDEATSFDQRDNYARVKKNNNKYLIETTGI